MEKIECPVCHNTDPSKMQPETRFTKMGDRDARVLTDKTECLKCGTTWKPAP